MLTKIKELIERCKTNIEQAHSTHDINELRVKYLGKNGEYTGLLRGLKDVPPAERSTVGKLINEGKQRIEAMLSKVEADYKAKEEEKRLKSERIDVTLSHGANVGSTHPITKVKNDILNTFIGLGFSVKEGPEIETDYYNFQTLGIPADHPARDMQDTFISARTFCFARILRRCSLVRCSRKNRPFASLSPARFIARTMTPHTARSSIRSKDFA